MDLFQFITGDQYRTFALYKFTFLDFLVEQFSIKSNELDGACDVTGLFARGSMKVSLAVQWNNYLTGLEDVHFVPLPSMSLKIPSFAIIELLLVNIEGNAVANVPVIKDLVRIEIVEKHTATSPAPIFYSQAFNVRYSVIE
ncbi:hypothetical protein RF11_02914 [Thelohanellus kitauei]|uniref:Uncharacterized protein n=1 Tax=Thelohanellus kitauei TaxID=669202 RepID=A0A0C2N4W7_THEKT|nr:hypothetical protein RF11_02914 [Thelohanellus kitauei]